MKTIKIIPTEILIPLVTKHKSCKQSEWVKAMEFITRDHDIDIKKDQAKLKHIAKEIIIEEYPYFKIADELQHTCPTEDPMEFSDNFKTLIGVNGHMFIRTARPGEVPLKVIESNKTQVLVKS